MLDCTDHLTLTARHAIMNLSSINQTNCRHIMLEQCTLQHQSLHLSCPQGNWMAANLLLSPCTSHKQPSALGALPYSWLWIQTAALTRGLGGLQSAKVWLYCKHRVRCAAKSNHYSAEKHKQAHGEVCSARIEPESQGFAKRCRLLILFGGVLQFIGTHLSLRRLLHEQSPP
jgi:hypothetical protein